MKTIATILSCIVFASACATGAYAPEEDAGAQGNAPGVSNNTPSNVNNTNDDADDDVEEATDDDTSEDADDDVKATDDEDEEDVSDEEPASEPEPAANDDDVADDADDDVIEPEVMDEDEEEVSEEEPASEPEPTTDDSDVIIDLDPNGYCVDKSPGDSFACITAGGVYGTGSCDENLIPTACRSLPEQHPQPEQPTVAPVCVAGTTQIACLTENNTDGYKSCNAAGQYTECVETAPQTQPPVVVAPAEEEEEESVETWIYTVTISVDPSREDLEDGDFPNFLFTHMAVDADGAAIEGGELFFPGQTCSGSGATRTCELLVDPAHIWRMYAKTGLDGLGSWLPGFNNVTDECEQIANVAVIAKDANGSTFNMTPRVVRNNKGDGCEFEIGAYGEGAESEPTPDPTPEDPSSVQTMTFEVLVGANGATGAIYGYADQFGTGSCASAMVEDPTQDENVAVPGVVCDMDVDRSKLFEGNLKTVANGTELWVSGYVDGPGDCQKRIRMYVYDEDGLPVADYDTLSETSFPQQMTSAVASDNANSCHFFLAADPALI